MSSPNSNNETAQPSLPEILARLLRRQSTAHELGLAVAEVTGEVVPFETAPTQPIDPRLAWREGLTALGLASASLDLESFRAPPEWPALVQSLEPIYALPICAGNFPQLLRNWLELLKSSDLVALVPQDQERPSVVSSQIKQTRASASVPQRLLAAGVLRLSRSWDGAEEILSAIGSAISSPWSNALENEKAALAWHRGRVQEAVDCWERLSLMPATTFNRGMAKLFLGSPAEARPLLRQAADALPEEDGWHHLARLYLALAESRSISTAS